MKILTIDTSALSETNRIIVEAIYQEREDELLASDEINLDALLETDEEKVERLEKDLNFWREKYLDASHQLEIEQMQHSQTANAFIAEMEEHAVSENRIADLESMLTDAENELIRERDAHHSLQFKHDKVLNAMDDVVETASNWRNL